jgi:hypothetical protein
MKKISLLLLVLGAMASSCSKTTKIPVAYSVETPQGNALTDIYIPDSGSYDLPVLVKFLSGSSTDRVTLMLTGLPASVTATSDSISGIPTFSADFVLNTNHADHITFPVSLVSSAQGSVSKHADFLVHIIPADCATLLFGTYSGSNACTARNYTYTAVAGSHGTANTLNINNFGGYGTSTNTYVTVNCAHDSLYIPSQNIGNGTTLEGYGVFAANQMTVYYTATNTPGGFAETCTAVLNK